MKTGWQWPVLIGALLALGVGVNVALMVAATGDPAFSVEPDYYGKAVRWDDRMAQERVNAELGWRADLESVPAGEGCTIVVSLRDRSGAPVEGAEVTIEAFHNARASSVLRATLAATGTGYTALLPVRKAGLWEFRLSARRGDEAFTSVVARDVETGR